MAEATRSRGPRFKNLEFLDRHRKCVDTLVEDVVKIVNEVGHVRAEGRKSLMTFRRIRSFFNIS